MTEFVPPSDSVFDTEDYECLYFYDGPLTVRFKGDRSLTFGMITGDPHDFPRGTWPMQTVTVTPEAWRAYRDKEIDWRTLWTDGSDHCRVDLNAKPFVFVPHPLDVSQLPAPGVRLEPDGVEMSP